MTDKPISKIIKDRIDQSSASSARCWAGDNIADHIRDHELPLLIDELTGKFESVLDSLIIDRENDPMSVPGKILCV